MRRVLLFLLLVTAVTPPAVVLAAGPAHAACAAPTVAVKPTSGSAGQSVVVTGSGFKSCVDTVVCVVGQACPAQPPAEPLKNIGIRFMQGNRADPLTTVNAAADGTFKTTVTIPSTAGLGAASIGTQDGSTAAFTVTAGLQQTASASRPAAIAATGTPAYTNSAFGVALVAIGMLLVGLSGLGRRDPRTA